MNRERSWSVSFLRAAVAAGALAVLGWAAPPLAAQPPDVVPRTMFLAATADGEPPIAETECLPAFCKFYPDDGAFESTPIWSHTTNISPFLLWLEIHMELSDGRTLHRHVELKPGETHWVILHIPRGHWGWIQLWTTIPAQEVPPGEVLPKQVELAFTSSTLEQHPQLGLVRVNETVATIQMGRSPFGPPGSATMAVEPGPDTPAWNVRTLFAGDGALASSREGWQGAGDPRLDRRVQSSVRQLPDGYVLGQEADEDRDGTVDRATRLRYRQTAAGKRLVLTGFEAGREVYRRTVTKRHNGDRALRRIVVDSNADGITDELETEVSRAVDGVTWREFRRDFDADGTVDEIERTRLSSFGPRHSAQLTDIFTGDGVLKEKIAIRTNPTPEGYRIVTLHDEDGDAVYDSREVQTSRVGPFGDGVDVDTVQIDLGNDGGFDTSHTSTARKILGPNSYRETVKSDLWSDGAVEAVTRRSMSFAPR
jgi:hypothetical protein